MSQYKITNDELGDLARDIYEEACGGYLDLKESICDKIVREFVKRLTPVIPPTPVAPYSDRSNNNEYAGPENNPATWTYGTTTTTTGSVSHGWAPITASNVVFSSVGGGSGGSGMARTQIITEEQVRVADEMIVSLRPQEYLRPEDYMNTGTNYLGNESERF